MAVGAPEAACCSCTLRQGLMRLPDCHKQLQQVQGERGGLRRRDEAYSSFHMYLAYWKGKKEEKISRIEAQMNYKSHFFIVFVPSFYFFPFL